MTKPILTAVCLMLVPFITPAAEQTVRDTTPAMERTAPDNTSVNKRDRNTQTLTPLDQSNTKADTDITQAVRKSIMNEQLSMNAKNIKIITQNGEVTLRGPVDSSAERNKIVELANAVPGIRSVNNQLEVK